MLAYIVAAVGVFVVAMGALGAAVPATMRDLLQSAHTAKVVYGAIGFRLLAGAFFVFASDACAWPAAIGAVGVIMLAAGFIGLFIGVDRVMALTSWFMGFSDNMFRLWSLGAIGFSVFIVYAAV